MDQTGTTLASGKAQQVHGGCVPGRGLGGAPVSFGPKGGGGFQAAVFLLAMDCQFPRQLQSEKRKVKLDQYNATEPAVPTETQMFSPVILPHVGQLCPRELWQSYLDSY